MHLSSQAFADFDGQFEYWNEASETAWVVRNSPGHEGEATMLIFLFSIISLMRGTQMRCYGAMDLVRYGPKGPREAMQASQTVYLHPERASLPGLEAMVVGENDCPDVTMQVDHSTDSRPWKLAKYAEWGFPEVWVEVPDRPARGRSANRRSGLTIYLLEPGDDGPSYVAARTSRAFPGWTSAEIHEGINEDVISPRTSAILARVGQALGEREGTGPEDDPMASSLMRSARAAQGRAEGQAATIAQVLVARNIEVSPGFAADLVALVDASQESLVASALACNDENDFRRRIRALQRH